MITNIDWFFVSLWSSGNQYDIQHLSLILHYVKKLCLIDLNLHSIDAILLTSSLNVPQVFLMGNRDFAHKMDKFVTFCCVFVKECTGIFWLRNEMTIFKCDGSVVVLHWCLYYTKSVLLHKKLIDSFIFVVQHYDERMRAAKICSYLASMFYC